MRVIKKKKKKQLCLSHRLQKTFFFATANGDEKQMSLQDQAVIPPSPPALAQSPPELHVYKKATLVLLQLQLATLSGWGASRENLQEIKM